MKKAGLFVLMLCAAVAGFAAPVKGSPMKGNPMHEAVYSCDYERVRQLILDTDAATHWSWFSRDAQGLDQYSRTPVYNLYHCDSFEGVKILNALIVMNENEKLGIEFNKVYDNYHSTPFHTFAEDGNLTMVKVFADKNFRKEMDDLLKRPDVNKYDMFLQPALGKLPPADVNTKDRAGDTPADSVSQRMQDNVTQQQLRNYTEILHIISEAGGKMTPPAVPSKFFTQSVKKGNAKITAANDSIGK